jgi:glycosyltransferase involved in cell wall biosynthesis
MVLINELRKNGLDFSYSLYHPHYTYAKYKANQLTEVTGSPLYDHVNNWVWRFRNLLPILQKSKYYQDITYPLFDKVTSKKLEPNTVLFGWPQMSLSCMKSVSESGGLNILEYPIAHVSTWKRYLQEESKLYDIKYKYSFFSRNMEKRMLGEIRQADFISIPSTFVKNSFLENNISEGQLIINPYGINADFFHPEEKYLDQPFTVIAVGSVEIRKGFQYLLEAFHCLGLKDAELIIIGKIHPHFQRIKAKYDKNLSIKFLGNLSREDTAKAMRKADVKVMPSLVEGLSLVILETMASGTPVISSENAGGLDVIEEGEDGFIVPIREVDAIAERLRWCYAHREDLIHMGKKARKKVVEHYTEAKYGKRAYTNLLNYLKI